MPLSRRFTGLLGNCSATDRQPTDISALNAVYNRLPVHRSPYRLSFRVADDPLGISKHYAVTQDLAARGQALEPLERPPSGPKSTPINGPLRSWACSE
jgi:hypothetical protein